MDKWYRVLAYLPLVGICVIVAVETWIFFDTILSYHQNALWIIVVTTTIEALFLLNFALTCFVNPGSIPSSDVWNIANKDARVALPRIHERKYNMKGALDPGNSDTGSIRVCRWCEKIKPDRTHHCSRCSTCVLRLDHHCTFINRCIGHYNVKYFALMLIYGFLLLAFVEALCIPVVSDMTALRLQFIEAGVAWKVMFLFVQNSLMLLVVGSYAFFFLYLVCENRTTLEFCEKSLKARRNISVNWDRGVLANLKQVFGNNVLLWPLPTVHDIGDGLSFTPSDRAEQSEPRQLEQLHALVSH